MDLSSFHTNGFDRGRPAWMELLWMLLQALFVDSWMPGSAHRVWLLRMFGARIGRGAVLKPHLRIKFPWRLALGDNVWLGEGVWIDNLALVNLGSNVCVSQGAYLCTGSHDWSRATFDLIVEPIRVEAGAWIAARATVAPGVTVGEGAVLGLGSVASVDLQPWTVYQGCPAGAVRQRIMVSQRAVPGSMESNS